MIQKVKTIANSFAEEYCSDAIYPAHLFKAVLHKDAGLVHFLEKDLDKDYFYLQDWADVQMQLSPRAARPMRDLDYSEEARTVLDEAENYKVKFDLEECTEVCILAALVTPGVGFTFDQLKTLPLTPSEISARMGGGVSVEAPYMEGAGLSGKGGKGSLAKYCTDKTAMARAGKLDKVVGFENQIGTIYEILGRKTKANLLITGESGVGKTSLVNLIPRFYDVTQGAIRIDGTDIRDVTKHSLRSAVGIVQQEVFIFADTIRENNIVEGVLGLNRDED